MQSTKKYHLAIDIGASSGRHILGYEENGVLKTEEIYRFQNAPHRKSGYGGRARRNRLSAAHVGCSAAV